MIHKDIESLSPTVQPIFKEFVAKLNEAGIKYVILETLRDLDVQEAYYAQGRRSLPVVNSLRSFAGLAMLPPDENNYTITNCDGNKIKSKHQLGLAMDVAPLDAEGNVNWQASKEEWEAIGTIGESVGLIWGAHFKGLTDSPHFEVAS